MGRVIGIAGAVGGLLTLILQIVSLATPNWIETVAGSQGLWQVCVEIIGCSSIPSSILLDFYKAVQAFMIIGCLLLAALLGVSVLVVLGKGSDSTPKSIVATSSAAAISILIAMAVFTAEAEKESSAFPYGYSFYLGWVSFALSSILSVVLAVSSRST